MPIESPEQRVCTVVKVVVDVAPAPAAAWGQEDGSFEVRRDAEVATGPPPRQRSRAAAQSVSFVGCVRRVDARLWVTDDHGKVTPGVAASFASGTLRCEDATAVLEAVQVCRRVFATPGTPQLDAGRGTVYESVAVAHPTSRKLVASFREEVGTLEGQVAEQAAAGGLVVLDGPLRDGHPAGVVGCVKPGSLHNSNREHAERATSLVEGRRTPLVVTTAGVYSWFLRLPLPGGPRHPWDGVVRLEVSSQLPLDEAVRTAHLVTATLPRFGPRRHLDPQSAQHLVPVAGLKARLGHRLGDPGLVVRRLQRAAAMTRSAADNPPDT